MTEEQRATRQAGRKRKREKLLKKCNYQLTLWLPITTDIGNLAGQLKRNKADYIVKFKAFDEVPHHAIFTEGKLIKDAPKNSPDYKHYVKANR